MAPAFQAAWVAVVRSTADRLEGDLHRCDSKETADYATAKESIARAREYAGGSQSAAGTLGANRRGWRRLGAWWSGQDVDQAWAALHTAGQALLGIESEAEVKAQLGDMAATVVTSLSKGDLRVKDYLSTLRLLAPPDRTLTPADRAQLRAIRQACDSSSDGSHADARSYRNTLIMVGALLAAVLVAVAIMGFGDKGFRTVFAPTNTTVSRWYILELEVVASLAGLTGAVLSLRNYGGFQFSYGLPLVQAFLKGGTGAATGLFGVLLVQAGIITSLKTQSGGGVFAVAVIFGYAQYLFTRAVDQQANKVLASASSRNDPGTTPHAQAGCDPSSFLTTDQTPPGSAD